MSSFLLKAIPKITRSRSVGAWQPAEPEKDITVLVQAGRGKGDAVRLGFAQATGDILMILDADLSVAPEDLPQFYDALVSGKESSSTAHG